MIFGYFYYLTALGYWLLGWLLPEQPAAGGETGHLPASAPALAGLGAILCLAFAGQLAVIHRLSGNQEYLPGLPPIPLVPLDLYVPDWDGALLLLLAGVQCIALASIYRTLRNRTIGPGASAVLAATCLTLFAVAFTTRSTTSADIYLYVGLAHLGAAAYSPPDTPLAGEFASINRMWGRPLYPSAYGPVWVLLSSAIVHLGSSLAAQLAIFRTLGALALGVCIRVLFALRVAPAVIALFALNPALVEQFVANGHNDLIPLAFTLGALVAARRGALAVAVLFVAAAGASKLPFALIGCLVFTGIADLRRRIVASAAAVALALAVTVAGSSGRYFTTAATIAHVTFGHPADLATKLSYAAAAAAALAALAVAIVWRRFNPLAAWSLATLSIVIYPWYLAWCVPYALIEGSFFPQFLIALPAAAFFLTDIYSHVPLVRAAYGLVALAPIAILVVHRRRAVL
jgi:hypothetical protein